MSKALRKEENQLQSITLFLMTEKGFCFLNETVTKYKSLYSLVVVGRDNSIHKDCEAEIIALCIRENIAYIKRQDFIQVNTKYVIAISWRWLIKHPENELIIFHDSLIPKYRGFAPLVNALINGEKEIGVTALLGSSQYDAGDVIVQFKSLISYPIKIKDAILLNNVNYLKCATFVLDKILKGKPIAVKKQNEENASYSVWLDEQDYAIDWSKSSEDICRFIDSVGFPYKGAFSYCAGRLIRILNAEMSKDVEIENRCPGKVLFLLQDRPVVICGEGTLRITEAFIQEGKKQIPFFPLTKFRLKFTSSLST